MKLWIRIDASIGTDPRTWDLADFLGVSAECAVGHLVVLYGAMAEHCKDGSLVNVQASLLERWANWRGESGQFASAFSQLFVTEGQVTEWLSQQGKLLERADKERERWHRRNSAETPVARNGTERNELPTTPTPRFVEVEFANDWQALRQRIEASGGNVLSWEAELSATLDGMHGLTATPRQISEALRHFAGNGANLSLRLFLGYLRSAIKGPTEKPHSRSSGLNQQQKNDAVLDNWLAKKEARNG